MFEWRPNKRHIEQLRALLTAEAERGKSKTPKTMRNDLRPCMKLDIEQQFPAPPSMPKRRRTPPETAPATAEAARARARLIGQHGMWLTRKSEFPIVIQWVENQYGVLRYLITPRDGKGSSWVNADKVRLTDPEPPPEERTNR